MRRLNAFIRVCLFKRLLLPYAILVCLNIFLGLMPSETSIRIAFIFISAALIAITSLGVILYPRLKRVKNYYHLKYAQYLDDRSRYYHKKAKKKQKKIDKIKSLQTTNFVLCQEHNLQESSQIADKLFAEGDKRKDEVLQGFYKDLSILKNKEKECKEYYESFKKMNHGKFSPARQ